MFAVSTRITRYNRNYELASTGTRVYVCVQVHVGGAHPSARVEAKSEGALLNTFAYPALSTQASSFDRPVDRVGYAPLQPESR